MSARNRFQSNTDNPIRTLRERLRLSQAQLAKRLSLTPQVVLLNEMGVYGSCNPTILEFLADHYDGPLPVGKSSAQALSQSYDIWRKDAARYALGQARYTVRDIVGIEFPVTPGYFNFEDVRKWSRFKNQFASSLVGFCKVVKLQPSIVSVFESSNFRNNVEHVLVWLEENSGVAHVD